MDEPLGAVDFQMRKLLQIQMEAMLQQRKVTTMMVTHDVDEAIYFSDRVIVMSRDHGRIMADVQIDLPRPRDRTGLRYHEYMDQLTEILKQALNGEVFKRGGQRPHAVLSKTWRPARTFTRGAPFWARTSPRPPPRKNAGTSCAETGNVTI